MDVLRIPPHQKKPPSKAQGLVDQISAAFRTLTDTRKPGNNTKYAPFDAACSAFSVFFTQSPSFLAFQRNLSQTVGRNNVQSLFGVHYVPTDVQIRNILDTVDPKEVFPLIREVGDTLRAEGCLSDYRVLKGTFLLALDGTHTDFDLPFEPVQDGGVSVRHQEKGLELLESLEALLEKTVPVSVVAGLRHFSMKTRRIFKSWIFLNSI